MGAAESPLDERVSSSPLIPHSASLLLTLTMDVPVVGLLAGSGCIQLRIRSQKRGEYSGDWQSTPFRIWSHSFPPVGKRLPKLYIVS